MMFKSNGKLLLTGEYFVLDGALSIALPCNKGQSMEVRQRKDEKIHWKSIDKDGKIWYEKDLFVGEKDQITQTLENILNTAKQKNPSFDPTAVDVTTKLEFDRQWGLGSSSTLIKNISFWAEVDAFELLFDSFGGSGYDIACAGAKTPILYRLLDKKPEIYPILFDPPFAHMLFFVYLGKKQNSKEGIERYKKIKKGKKKIKEIETISTITQDILRANNCDEFCRLIQWHQDVVSSFIGIEKIEQEYFPDFQGSLKSLGAWGGDFALAVGQEKYVRDYFEKKGLKTVIPFKEMVI